ncbi:hypothetical protein [Chryseobacterium limigenitum]|uniref:Uncharacterized protein n=1 Tax=Chryseobacterium limigenitum TaxID=1612149 RepID=A0A1K2IPV7_9FLAO|nr:hypothetical protein [Chryseobacterium limigenitum]SFZ94232.1 hypothetical protein SAMN05216324_106160 [Chryseobacterium limigenitum]
MAISKKGLRKINVNNEIFYWKIRRKISHNEAHNDEYSIPVQHESEGQLLFVNVNFGRSYGYGDDFIKSVTPVMIKEKIIEAINLGWKYNEKGNPICLSQGKLVTDTKYQISD